MPGSDGVGIVEQAVLDRLPDLVALLVPPFAGAAEIRGWVEKQCPGSGILAGAAAPADSFERQAGVINQPARHPADRRIDSAFALHQGKARFGQTPVIFAGISEQAPGGMPAPVPQQPIEPEIVIVNAEQGLVLAQEAFFLVRRKIGVDPGVTEHLTAGVDIAIGD